MQDICDEQGDILEYNDFVQKFGHCINWLEYKGMIDAIPGHWKFFLRTDNLTDKQINCAEVLKGKKVANKVYQMLISDGEAIIKHRR